MADITSLVRRLDSIVAATLEITNGPGKLAGGAPSTTSNTATIPSGYKILLPARGNSPAEALEFISDAVVTGLVDNDFVYVRRLPGGASYEAAAAQSVPADAVEVGQFDIFNGDVLNEAPSASGTGIKSYIHVDLSSNQTTNLTAPFHLQFDRILNGSGGLTLSAGTAQQLGLVTLAKGKVYCVRAGFTFEGDADTAQLCCKIYNVTDDQEEGVAGMIKPKSRATSPHNDDSNEALAYIDARDEAKVVECRILSGANVTIIFTGTTGDGPSWMSAQEL